MITCYLFLNRASGVLGHMEGHSKREWAAVPDQRMPLKRRWGDLVLNMHYSGLEFVCRCFATYGSVVTESKAFSREESLQIAGQLQRSLCSVWQSALTSLHFGLCLNPSWLLMQNVTTCYNVSVVERQFFFFTAQIQLKPFKGISHLN